MLQTNRCAFNPSKEERERGMRTQRGTNKSCHAHTQTHTRTHTLTRTRAHTCTHTHAQARTHVHTHTHTHTYTHTHTHTRTHTHTHTHRPSQPASDHLGKQRHARLVFSSVHPHASSCPTPAQPSCYTRTTAACNHHHQQRPQTVRGCKSDNPHLSLVPSVPVSVSLVSSRARLGQNHRHPWPERLLDL